MLKKILYVSGALSILGLLGKVYHDTNVVKVTPVTFMTNRLRKDNNISILQISDLHNKTFGNHHQSLIKQIKRVNADIIVITGDLIDRKTMDFRAVIRFVNELKKMNQHIFYVTGNHERDNLYLNKFLLQLETSGVRILDNKTTYLQHNEEQIQLMGISGDSLKNGNIKELLQKVDDRNFTLFLSHVPNAVKYLTGTSIDLVLSGHTHGGQIRLPVIGSVMVPDQGLFPYFDKGVYEWEKGKLLYIDSGAGTTRLPVRFLNQSQISIIHIRGNKS
ncbi:metallophosphoesterase [Gracilibacillus xinjiangensis]|uniref:Metallophosphoesterase n=1 Tax=Gracilibacillus xinjiangensis TaxID=1193282 RepID=A0ABV8WWC2_9BACI